MPDCSCAPVDHVPASETGLRAAPCGYLARRHDAKERDQMYIGIGTLILIIILLIILT